MSYVIVLPSIWQPYTDDCLASMSDSVRDNTMIVDNTERNLGVAPSWNLGVQYMRANNDGWLVLLSAAVRFKNGGDDFVKELEQPGFDIVEARPVYGWHCIAFNRKVFDNIGCFDENLRNYYNDIDLTLRIQKAYAPKDPPWNKVTIDVHDMGMAHGLKLAGVQDSAEPYIEYLTRKWGRHPDHSSEPTYDRPFNDPSNSLDYWPHV